MAFFSRGKNRVQNPYTLPDMYERYIQEYSVIYKVDYSVFVKIVSEFYKQVMEEVLYNAKSFKLPFRMGRLMVVKTKVNLDHLNARLMDWQKAVQVGKRVYHLNEHSNGYKYYFFWNKSDCIIENAFFYRLIPTRANKRLLAKLIKSGDYDYFEKQ